MITDIYMPEVDGIEMLGNLKATRPGVPVIAISSSDSMIDLLPLAGRLGAVRTLHKPFTGAQLLEAVGAALRRAVGGSVHAPHKHAPLRSS